MNATAKAMITTLPANLRGTAAQNRQHFVLQQLPDRCGVNLHVLSLQSRKTYPQSCASANQRRC
jgi:hypothetical protein